MDPETPQSHSRCQWDRTCMLPFHARDGHMLSDDRGAQWPTLAVLTLELTSTPAEWAW